MDLLRMKSYVKDFLKGIVKGKVRHKSNEGLFRGNHETKSPS
ncbi:MULTISPECIES: hypothetical protein [Bacillaceae]|nr:hypothetical protein [Bacillus sp. S3]